MRGKWQGNEGATVYSLRFILKVLTGSIVEQLRFYSFLFEPLDVSKQHSFLVKYKLRREHLRVILR